MQTLLQCSRLKCLIQTSGPASLRRLELSVSHSDYLGCLTHPLNIIIMLETKVEPGDKYQNRRSNYFSLAHGALINMLFQG